MKYRKFEAGNIDVSLLGFGAMRLPVMEDGSGAVDEAEATRMIRYAIDHGVNYVDTAYVYHGMKGENIVGRALADGYREKILLATKMPIWTFDSPDRMEPLFEEQFIKLNTEVIDMYLVHNITGGTFGKVKDFKIWDFLAKKREEGKIRFIGFSFHGESPAEFKEILDAYPWDFCQLQINYIDKDIQAGVEGYEYAVSKGVPIILMEPLKGGKLTDIMPPSIQKYWDSLESERSPAEWALRWAANLPGILTILSGMSTMEQVIENIKVLSDADIGSLSESELEIIDQVSEEYRKLIPYQCTACKYCLPCTVEIDIPMIMDCRNSCDAYGKTSKIQDFYDMWTVHGPSECTACGKCEAVCPQHLKIIQAMKEAAELFE